MTPAQIAILLDPFLKTPAGPASPACHSELPNAGEEPAVLSDAQLHNISIYIDLLLRWNARINLTAIRDPEEIVTRHFGESLFAARVLLPRQAHVETATPACPAEGSSASLNSNEHSRGYRGRAALQGRVTDADKVGALAPVRTVADIGSGAGFPGLPIKLWAPEISLTLIESNHKKAAFLREVTRALTLTDVYIQTARAETLAGFSFDVVTLRAVERFLSILPTAGNLVGTSGRLTLLIGSGQIDQASASLAGLSWSLPIPVPLSSSRVVLVARRP